MYILLWLGVMIVTTVSGQENSVTSNDLVSRFANCKWDSPNFDQCVKDGLNSCRVYFKTGVPDLKIPPFDPFFAKELVQTRGGSNFNYKLILRNVYERGWTESMITKFKSNRKKKWVQYTQYFPEKSLDGDYEFKGKIMSSNVDNSGRWNLTLYDYIQTTTLTKPVSSENLKVRIEVQSIGDMDLHVGNLLRGRRIMESLLDRVINVSWRPGFTVVRPLINDIVSTAFTDIFNNAFADLDLSAIIKV